MITRWKENMWPGACTMMQVINNQGIFSWPGLTNPYNGDIAKGDYDAPYQLNQSFFDWIRMWLCEIGGVGISWPITSYNSMRLKSSAAAAAKTGRKRKQRKTNNASVDHCECLYSLRKLRKSQSYSLSCSKSSLHQKDPKSKYLNELKTVSELFVNN